MFFINPKSKSMKKLFLLIISIATIGCTNDDKEITQSSNLRKNFKNWEEFSKEYIKLTGNLTSYSVKSLQLMDENNDRYELSPILNEFLDENDEFEVENKIIKFHKGHFYSFNKSDYSKIDFSKIDFTILTPIENIKVETVNDSISTDNQRITMGVNNLNSLYQKEFFRQSYLDCSTNTLYGPTTKKQKYVHELKTERIIAGALYNYNLYLVLKLEWNSSGNTWKYAAEKRNMYVNIYENSYLTDYNGIVYAPSAISTLPTATVQQNKNISFNCANNVSIHLRSYNIYGSGYVQWSVEVLGDIRHQINGDANINKWYNNVSW